MLSSKTMMQILIHFVINILKCFSFFTGMIEVKIEDHFWKSIIMDFYKNESEKDLLRELNKRT